MGVKIKIELSDWRFNAGILGFYNILTHAGDIIQINNNYIEFEDNVLSGFEQKYFKYLIDTYEEITHWEMLKRFYNKIQEHYLDEFNCFTEKNLSVLNEFIKDLKGYLKRPNYRKVYGFINSEINIEEEEKLLKSIIVSKGQTIDDVKDNLKEQFNIIGKIYNYVYSDGGRKYLFAKTLIYNIVNQAWEGVAFLNRNTKENDIYIDYKKNFVDPTVEYLNEDKSNYKLSCFVTDLPIKNKSSAHDIGFLIDTGFDTNRKTSHVWDFYNDIYVCDLTRLIYSCIPCGIFYATNEDGIFINSNQNVEELIRVNDNVKQSIRKSIRDGETNRNLYTYKGLVESIQKEANNRISYELADVQIIRKVNSKYRFNVLSKEIISIINESKKQLNSIVPVGYKEGRTYYYLYPLVIDRILNGVNMFTLIHKLLINKLTKSEGIANFFNIYHINCLNTINVNFLEGVTNVVKNDIKKETIRNANRDGWLLGEVYKKNANSEKVNGIAYRLLNALKTRNAESFLHNLLNSYMYVDKQIPKSLVQVLENEDELGIIGYAFVTGLVSSSLAEEIKVSAPNN